MSDHLRVRYEILTDQSPEVLQRDLKTIKWERYFADLTRTERQLQESISTREYLNDVVNRLTA